jgi:hypothetical protein
VNSSRQVNCLSGVMGDRCGDSMSECAWQVAYQSAMSYGMSACMRVRASCVTCVRVCDMCVCRHTGRQAYMCERTGVRTGVRVARVWAGVHVCREHGREACRPVGKARNSQTIFRNGHPPCEIQTVSVRTRVREFNILSNTPDRAAMLDYVGLC